MKKLRIAGIIVLGAVALYTGVGFLLIPFAAKSLLPEKMGKALGRKVSVDDITFNPYKLKLILTGFSIKEKDDARTFFSFEEFLLDLSVMSLFKAALISEELRITRPHIRVEKLQSGDFNFSDIMPASDKKPDDKSRASEPLRFSLANIQVVDGSLEFLEATKGKQHRLEKVDFTLPFISNFHYHQKTEVRPSFKALLDGAILDLSSTALPFSENRQTSIRLDLKDIDLTRYTPYVPVEMNLRIENAFLDLAFLMEYETRIDTGARLSVSGEIRLRELRINEKKGDQLFHLPLLLVRVKESELLSQHIHIEEISIDSPNLNLKRHKDGSLNILGFFPKQAQEKKKEEEKEEKGKRAPSIRIDSVNLGGGTILFDDASVTDGFRSSVKELSLKASGYESDGKKPVDFSLSMKTDRGLSLVAAGELGLEPFAGKGSISMGPIGLSDYAPYYKEQILFDIAKGSLTTATNFSFSTRSPSGNPAFVLSELKAELTDLTLVGRNDKNIFYQAGLIKLEGGSIDLEKRQIYVSSVTASEGRLALERNKDGELNLQRLFPKGGNPGQPRPSAEATKQEAMTFSIKQFFLRGYSVDFRDSSTPSPVSLAIKGITLEARDLSTSKDARAALSLSLEPAPKAGVSIAGSISMDPLSLSLDLKLDNVPITPFQGYWMPVLDISTPRGSLSVRGTAKFALNSLKAPTWNFAGDLFLRDLLVLEREKGREVLRWRAFDIAKFSIASSPLSISAQTIRLLSPSLRLAVEKDGSINLMRLIAKSDSDGKKPAGDSKEKDKGLSLNLRNISLQDGSIQFRDSSISPAYSAWIKAISLNLRGLNTENTRASDLSFSALLDGHSPLKVNGRVNPLLKEPYADLAIDFRAIPLSPFTPYSGTYLGYAIERGNLSLDLKYLLEKMRLEATNRIVIDQLTLGKAVESPKAKSLPIGIAIALLKNRKGVIELNLPIKGRLDDPQFSFGHIIVQMLLNILEKAVTAPFALLGSLLGAGEEISHFDFRPGSSEVPPEGASSLDTLVDMLYDRPELKLEIMGFVDQREDTEAMRDFKLTAALKTMKIKEAEKKGLASPPLEEISLSEQERAGYLWKLYEQKVGPKAKDTPRTEENLKAIERELRGSFDVSLDELRLLAQERINRVKGYILKSGRITPDRIFSLEAQTLTPEKKEGLVDSRVDFRLR